MLNLNLGCFNKKLPGFVNVDAREDVNPDVVDNAFTLEKFENNTASIIYCSHLLEHLDYKETSLALNRWYEVLKPGGILRLAVPDLEAVFAHYFYHKNLGELMHMIFGSQRHNFDYHKNGWVFESLSNDLLEAGFKSPERWEWQTTPPHNYCDDYSQSYYPAYAKQVNLANGKTVDFGGKLMSLNVQAYK